MHLNNPYTLIGAGSLFLSALAVACGSGIREIEIKPDPPGGGQQAFTIRFAPDETAVYDQIVVACTLQQELVLSTPDGGQTNQVCEAGVFTARQRDVKMVKGVDCYVSFFVQLGAQQICDMAGATQMQTNAPVTVARMKITAYRKGKAAWSIQTPARGMYRPGEVPGIPATGTNAAWQAGERGLSARIVDPRPPRLKRLLDGNGHVDS